MATDVTADTGLQTFIKKHATKPVTFQALNEFIEVVFDALKAQKTRNTELEARVKQLEADAVKFRGTFEGGKSYTAGEMVRHQGSLWICKVATEGTPSKDFVGWELALKKGDAR